MRGGKARFPREKGPHSEEERKIMKAALPELRRIAEEDAIGRAKQKLEAVVK
jgi:hypothetical protein